MEVISMNALEYARDMVNFVLDQHKIKWRLRCKLPFRIWVVPHTRFHINVGKVIMYFAKGSEKEDLLVTAPYLLQKVTSREELERFLNIFSNLYFNRYERNETSMLKVFAYIIEFSILYHLKKPDMLNAIETALRIVTEILMEENFIDTAGLIRLNLLATKMVEETGSNVRYSFYYKKFAW